MPRRNSSFILQPSAFRPALPRRAMTLAELVAVLAILAIVSGLVIPAVGHYMGDDVRDSVTRQSLVRLRDVAADIYWHDSCGCLPRPNLAVSPSRQDAPQLRYLFVNPDTETAAFCFDPEYRRGWRGPYLVERSDAPYRINTPANFTNRYGENGDPAVCDAWGRPIVVQCPGLLSDGRWDVRLMSAGPNGVLNIPPTVATSALTATDIGDDVWIGMELRP